MRIALTVGPDCDDAATAAERVLIEFGNNVTRFFEGPAFESAIVNRFVDAVIDLHLGKIDSPERLTAASRLGIPQIISVGGLANETPEQLDFIGKTIVERASASNGPTRIVLPLGEPLPILFKSIRNWVYPPSLLVEIDARLNSTVFGQELARELLLLIGSRA